MNTDTVAMKPNKVEVFSLRKTNFLFFTFDNPPPVKPPYSRVITSEMVKNRTGVKCGAVVNWTDHGRIAVVRSNEGVEGAFWHDELKLLFQN